MAGESIVQVTEGTGKKLHTWQRTVGANSVEDEVVLIGEPYLATYVAMTGSVSTATAASHLLQVMSGATLHTVIRRIQVYQVGLATTAAIARIALFRLTTAGTGGTGLTVQSADQADTFGGASQSLPTVKGTETSTAYHQASMQFIQTVGTGGAGKNSLLCEWDFTAQRVKGLRIATGVTNGLAVKMIDAVAAATVIVVCEFSEMNFSG